MTEHMSDAKEADNTPAQRRKLPKKRRKKGGQQRQCPVCRGAGSIGCGVDLATILPIEIAKKTGLHKSTISRMFSSNPEQRRGFSGESLIRVADALDVPVDEFVRVMGLRKKE